MTITEVLMAFICGGSCGLAYLAQARSTKALAAAKRAEELATLATETAQRAAAAKPPPRPATFGGR